MKKELNLLLCVIITVIVSINSWGQINVTWINPPGGIHTGTLCGPGFVTYVRNIPTGANVYVNITFPVCASTTYDWDLISYVPDPTCNTVPNPTIFHHHNPPQQNNPPACTNPCGVNADLYVYGAGLYVFRLCISNAGSSCNQTYCGDVTVLAKPPFNPPPQITLADISELTLPIPAGTLLNGSVTEPIDAFQVYWSQAASNPMPVPLPNPGDSPTNPISVPRLWGTVNTSINLSTITKPGTYCFTLHGRDELNATDSKTECFLVKPGLSNLGITITPPGTAPNVYNLPLPVNNVPLNAQITGINVYNDKVKYQWSQIAGPTAIPLPPAAYTANINDIPVTSSTFNLPPLNLNALSSGTYTLRLTVEDEYYNQVITEDITFYVVPPKSNLVTSVGPSVNITIDPYTDFTFSGQVSGINQYSDVIVTYWRAVSSNPAVISLNYTSNTPYSVPIGNTTHTDNVTMNQRIIEGVYEFWFVAKDTYYGDADSAKIEITVQPDQSNFTFTIDPSPQKEVVKTPEGFLFEDSEEPQNIPFSVRARVVGISDKTDYVRTYWRMTYEPELVDQPEQLEPNLPYTASFMKSLALGQTSDDSEVEFNLGNCSAGTYTLWYVARDMFYGVSDSVSTKIIVKRPVSIEPSVVFSPNGDGYNDVWQVKNIESFPFLGVRILNERGELVFETRSVSSLPGRGWDGRRMDGKLASEGAYYYQFYDTRDQKIFNTGSFVLIR